MWSEEEKKIYVCPITDGRYDPLQLRRAITIHSSGRFNAILHDLRSSDEVIAAKAMESLVDIGRKAFALKVLDTLDHAVYDAITAFTHYLSKKGQRVQSGQKPVPCINCP